MVENVEMMTGERRGVGCGAVARRDRYKQRRNTQREGAVFSPNSEWWRKRQGRKAIEMKPRSRDDWSQSVCHHLRNIIQKKGSYSSYNKRWLQTLTSFLWKLRVSSRKVMYLFDQIKALRPSSLTEI